MINNTNIYEYKVLRDDIKNKIEEFVADKSNIIEMSKEDNNETIYTLWEKNNKYCIIRAFFSGLVNKQLLISVDLAYSDKDDLIKEMFKRNPDVFRNTLKSK